MNIDYSLWHIIYGYKFFYCSFYKAAESVSPTPWIWTGLMTCFDQKQVADVILCDFQASALRDLRASMLPLLELYTLKQAQASLSEHERACGEKSRKRPCSNRGPAVPDIRAEAREVWGHPGPAGLAVSSTNWLIANTPVIPAHLLWSRGELS